MRPLPPADPDATLWSVVHVPASADGVNLVGWSLTDTSTGKVVATSGFGDAVRAATAIGGGAWVPFDKPWSTYARSPGLDTFFVERWCAAAPLSAATPFVVRLTSNVATPFATAAPLPAARAPSAASGASLAFINKGRCLVAPTDGLPAFRFPAPGGDFSSALRLRPAADCDLDGEQQLSKPDGSPWSLNVIKNLAQIGLSGFFSEDAFQDYAQLPDDAMYFARFGSECDPGPDGVCGLVDTWWPNADGSSTLLPMEHFDGGPPDDAFNRIYKGVNASAGCRDGYSLCARIESAAHAAQPRPRPPCRRPPLTLCL